MPDLNRRRSVRNGKTVISLKCYLSNNKPPQKTQAKTKPPHITSDESDSDSDAPMLLNKKDIERGALFFRSYENQMAVVPSILSTTKRRESAMVVARAYVKRVEASIRRQDEARLAKAQATKSYRRGALQFGSFGE